MTLRDEAKRRGVSVWQVRKDRTEAAPVIVPEVLPSVDGRSILVFRGWQHLDQEIVAEGISRHYLEAARAKGLPAETLASEVVPLIVFLAGRDTLELLDEDQMAEAGWVRKA